MADINEVITLGIGTPADIPHFILVGLSPAPPLPGGGEGEQPVGLGQDVTFSTKPELGGGSF